MSQYHALLGNTSSIGSNIIYTPTEENIKPGEDFVVYDKFEDKYKALRGRSYEEASFDKERYETNWDVVIGHKDGVTHAVAKDDAYGQSDTVADDTAAAPCYYRIELDRTQDGGFHYNLYSHDRQEGDVSWSANATMQSILDQIKVPSYSSKVLLSDGKGIGISLGGYGVNTCTITNITGTVNVIDMSQFATEDDYAEISYDSNSIYNIRPTADGTLANIQRFDGTGKSEIESLYGNSVVWNQIANESINNPYYTFNNGINGSITIKYIATNFNDPGNILFNLIKGHKYYMKTTSNADKFRLRNYYSGGLNINANEGIIYSYDVKDWPIVLCYINDIELGTYDLKIVVIDLTQMFGAGNEPTTVEQFKQWFPKDYYEYNAGEIINVNVNGYKTVGANLWDEEWESGILNEITGKFEPNPSYVRSKNFISVSPNTSYYIKAPNTTELLYYDANKNFMYYEIASKKIINTSSNCTYIKFFYFGKTYNNDICINISYPSFNGQYEPYKEDKINIPVKEIRGANNNLLFPDGLRSVGTAKDEVTPIKAVKRIEKIEFDGTESGMQYSSSYSGAPSLEYDMTGKISTSSPFVVSSIYPKRIYGGGYGILVSGSRVCIADPAYTSLEAWKSHLADLKAAGTPLTVYYVLKTPIEVNFSETPQTFGSRLDMEYKSNPYGTEEFLYDSEDIKVPASTSNTYESHMYAGAPYTEKNQTINDSFKNWRGASAQTILGSSKIPVGPNSSCLCNTNMNYSYRSGANFSGWNSWASTNGTTTFASDGVNGTTNNSAGVVMSQSTFNSNVNNTFAESTPNGKMYDYYNKLLNSEGSEFAYLHDQYVERYGTMNTLYDAYLMSHMVNTDNPSSGITYTAMNKGKQLTDVKGRVMTVNYDFNYMPAYPPEYNALHYGVSNKDSMFSKGKYNHPEVYDLGLMFRDDIMQKCNSNWSKIKGIKYMALANNKYNGSCAEYHSYTTWSFYGTYRCVDASNRYYAHFRSRPVLAFETF